MDGVFGRDNPVILVNNGTFGAPGMVTRMRYINDHVDGLAADLLPHGSTFHLAGAD